ncbi:unnamed protein product [Lactuca saligna]|uniref:Uncharacterized protein n=1 Tax=Lactuca saligna TaxID=75948 RepID=A0AA35VDJ4_LACSI|nr:unnamed protein product [Lactuca saligna]
MLSEENMSYNPCNQFSQNVPETQFQSSQPEYFQFRDSQNVESESSSDDLVPERNEEETTEELRPVLEKKCTFTNRQKSKKGVEHEELALAKDMSIVLKINSMETNDGSMHFGIGF